MISLIVRSIAAFFRAFWSDVVGAVTSVIHDPLLLLVIVLPVTIVGAVLYLVRDRNVSDR